MKEILFYTDNTLENTYLFEEVKKCILRADIPIVSVSLKPLDFGKNVIFSGERGKKTLYCQILLGLENCQADNIFFCEHDVLYHISHFDFVPYRNDIYYYNNNSYKYRLSDRKIISYDCGWLSQLCADRDLLIRHYTKRMEIDSGGYEPGTGRSRKVDDYGYEYFMSKYPNIDVRHGGNWTGVKRMKPEEFRDKRNCRNWKEASLENIPGWDYGYLMSL